MIPNNVGMICSLVRVRGVMSAYARYWRALYILIILCLCLTDKAKKDALRTATRVSELLVDTVNGGVEESFTNEKRIELEIRALASTIMRYKKQTDQWLAASHALNTVIKVCSLKNAL
ncbi:hypothetical protein BHM03_00007029 [Ensete ventricosum]|nr:hypothetical protein BHM03_00007029 [Ensete ventricosum]